MLKHHQRYVQHLPYPLKLYCIGDPLDVMSPDTITVYYTLVEATLKAKENEPVHKIILAEGAPVTLHIYTDNDIGLFEEVEIETSRITEKDGIYYYI